jgi:hypothetical protein
MPEDASLPSNSPTISHGESIREQIFHNGSGIPDWQKAQEEYTKTFDTQSTARVKSQARAAFELLAAGSTLGGEKAMV